MQERLFETYKRFYFLGIGGIGMSALARYFYRNGYVVAGYDKTPSPLTDALQAEGIRVSFEESILDMPIEYRPAEPETLVIITPAVPEDHEELEYFRAHGHDIMKRSEVLAHLCEGRCTIAVAGTHGKTSTAALMAHLMKSAGVDFHAFLGGISVNYQDNYIASHKGDAFKYIIVEADEYDRSFLRLHPDVAIITSIEADHLDIYGTLEALESAFDEFAGQVKPKGRIIVESDYAHKLSHPDKTLSYSIDSESNIKAENFRIENHSYVFDYTEQGKAPIKDIRLGIPGRHNTENCIAAIAAVRGFINNDESIRQAAASFKGVSRRFEVIYQDDTHLYVDDYAHHPTEIAATIRTLKELYPDRRIHGIFQPHLFSRTRDLATGFAESLSMLDAAWLLDIYPARELPMDGVTSELIYDKINVPHHKGIISKEEAIQRISEQLPELLLTIGAGDIDRLVQPIREIYEAKVLQAKKEAEAI